MFFEEKLAKDIAQAIHEKGGRAFFVGGKNRNHFMKQMEYPFAEKEDKDIDMEVYFLPKEVLAQILSQFGEIDYVGKSFGVFKLKHTNIDIALPRREVQAKILHNERTIILPHHIDKVEIENMYPNYKIKICPEESFGHKDFLIISDPFMSFKEAAERRDFTMNSIMVDVLSGEVFDPFNGIKDINNRLIRATNPKAFVEDSLRVYRAIQFSARLNFRIEENTKRLCQQVDLSSLPKERVYTELEKLLLKSQKPSIGFEYMKELGVLHYHPLLQALVNCPQEPSHHPEGSVWNHTMMVIDEAAKRKHESKNPVSFMWAALLHDIGKPATTEVKEGKITSYGHGKTGKELAVEYLKTLTDDKKLLEEVGSLVEHHMKPILFYKTKDTIQDGAFRRLATKVDLRELILLSVCDRMGRGGVDRKKELEEINWFKRRCENLHVLEEKPTPIVTGKLLLSLGFMPGPQMGEIIRTSYDLQLDKGWEKDELIRFVLETYKAS